MNDPTAWQGALPFDPQRSPWSDRTALRAEYREQLERLDRRLVGLGRDVLDLAARIDGPRGGPEPLSAVAVPAARRSLAELRRRAGLLEDATFALIALESPVGGDLRELVALIRALSDIVRAGEVAEHILDSIALLERCGVPTTGGELGRLRQAAVDIFRAAVDAWEDRDALAYNDLRTHDDAIDGLRDEIIDRHPACAESRCVTAHVLVVRFLERFADHGVDLCAHLSWAVTGDRVLADLGGGT